MLGAYQPQTSVMIRTASYVGQIQSLLNRSNPYPGEFARIIGEWLEANGQAVADMYIDDFNTKNPKRGMVPQIKFVVKWRSDITASGEYNPRDSSIIMHPQNLDEYREDVVNNLNNGGYKGGPDLAELLANTATAAFVISSIMHEALHHIQLFHIDKNIFNTRFPEGSEVEAIYEKYMFPYYFSTAEAAAWGISAAMTIAATVPTKYYSIGGIPTVKSINNYINSRNMLGIYGEADIGKFSTIDEDSLTQSFLDLHTKDFFQNPPNEGASLYLSRIYRE